MRLLTLLVAAGLAFTQAADAQGQDKVRIGVEGAYPPFSQVSPAGELEGFDIDIARALCEEMEVECELVQQDWDGIIPALLARKYDAIIASMTITEERKQSVDFTDRYYATAARFVAKKGSGIEISKEGLAGKRVGVQRATTHDAYVTDNYGDTVEVVRYTSQDEANLDMVSGRLDLLLADSIALSSGFLATPDGQGYEFVGEGLSDPQWFGEGVGIALRQGDDELRARFNEAIAAIRENGTYDEIAQKYFDFDVYGS
jgi:arginine/ornithine transport system substrate-binding protein